MNDYLIPANSKKSMLILSMFNKTDLIFLAVGGGITGIFMLTLPKETMMQIAYILSPFLICCFLVLPIPNQHNIRTFIVNIYQYFTNRRTYFWRGWCNGYVKDESK